MQVASLVLLVSLAFAIGRYSGPRTVYLIGTPLEPIATAEPDAGAAVNATRENQPTSSTDETVRICGAPTKTGKPCQRKVKGGGYCYQHRDKYGQKNAPVTAQ